MSELRHRLALMLELAGSGLRELWGHRLRSLLTLVLLMLGVFALVLMTAVLGGIQDQVRAGFKGMGWDGALKLQPRTSRSLEQRKRFDQSPGLRVDDLERIAAPSDRVLAFLPRIMRGVDARMAGRAEATQVIGVAPDYLAVMGRRIVSGRGLTGADQRRRSPVAVLGADLAARILGGADPVGREVVVEGVPFRVVGVLARQLPFNEDTWCENTGFLVPLEAYLDRLAPDRRLDSVQVKLKRARDLREVSELLLTRARQAHHGIDDLEVKNLDAEAARDYAQFQAQMRSWRTVLLGLAGGVLLVGGVGVLSVMLISCSERRYEIGLRKALGASDRVILGQFLLEAAVLGALGALAGTGAGALACRLLDSRFPSGLKLDPQALAAAWAVALVLAVGFGLYPALRAQRLSPMAAMR